MGLADVNYDIKILFFIVNSLVGVIPGIFLFGIGISTGVVSFALGLAAIFAVVGLALCGLAALGFAGAIRENKIMLYAWSAIMTLTAIVSVAFYAVANPQPRQTYLQYLRAVSNQYRDHDQRYNNPFESLQRAQEYASTQMTWLASTITHLVLVLVGVALAVKLALQARNQVRNQGIILSPAPTSYSPGV